MNLGGTTRTGFVDGAITTDVKRLSTNNPVEFQSLESPS